ncbi:MAG TPA: PAS domain S-box protein [Opitutus sp.]|nr:PAS domain S-box protein [Opitutus sp.]
MPPFVLVALILLAGIAFTLLLARSGIDAAPASSRSHHFAGGAVLAGSALSALLAALPLLLLFTRRWSLRSVQQHNESLKEIAERWKFAVEGSGDGIWDWDLTAGRTVYSDCGQKILGHAAGTVDVPERDWPVIADPADREQVVAGIRAHLSGATPAFRSEFRLQPQNGTRRWVLARGVVVKRSPDGTAQRMIGSLTDITERKLAESAVREREEEYRLLFDGMVEGFALHEIICDPAGRPVDYRFLAVNPAFERLTGIGSSAVIGRTVKEVMPETEHTWIEKYGTVALTGQSIEFESHSGALQRHFSVVAYCPRPGQFATIFVDVTEKKLAEQALIEREQRYERITAAITDYIYTVVVREGVAVSTTHGQGCLGVTGYTAEEFAARPTLWLDMVVPDDRPQVIEQARQALANEDPAPVEHRIRLKDGSTRWVRDTIVPQRNNGGVLEAYDGLIHDITLQKRAELSLLEANMLLQRTQEIANLGTYRFDILAGRWTSSVLLDRIFGIDASFNRTVEGWAALLDESERAAMLDYLANEVIAKKRRFDRVYPIVRAVDGQQRWVHGSGELQFDSTGQPIVLIGTIQDITEHRHAEADRARLVTAVEQAAESIVITDVRGTIVYVNPAYERTTGYSRVETLGRNPRMLKSGAQDKAFYSAMWNRLASGEIWSGHFVNRRKDGTALEEDATISPIRDPHGRVVNFVAVKRDVTRERLLESQVLQSQKMEAVGQLAGGVAHDFNNILAAVMMHIGLLQIDPSLDAEGQASLRELTLEVKRGAGLTRQLLAFSRKQAMEQRVLNLQDVVAGLLPMLRRLLGEHIAIDITPAAAPTVVNADASMVEQVVLNLCINSRDAMPRGGTVTIDLATVEIPATAEPEPDGFRPGRFVRLRVADTGTGIAPHVLPRIFEPFFTTKESGRGTGLGLSTVYGIIRQHHGWIRAQSTPGAGTSFETFWPASDQAWSAAPESNAPFPVHRGNETILLVEDAVDLRRTIAEGLKRHGYTVLQAGTGAEAIAVWREHAAAIKLLFTDIVMPGGMDGHELVAQLIADQPALKVIASTGYNPNDFTPNTRLPAGVRLLRKPYDLTGLLAAIRAKLDTA